MNRRVVLTRPAYNRPAVTRRSVGAGTIDGLGREESPLKGGSLPTPVTGSVKEEIGVSNVLDLANQLTAAQRQELLDQLALNNQLTNKAATNPDLDLWAQAIHNALGEVIGAEEGGSYGVMLIKRILGSTAAWRPVEKFMSVSRLGEAKRTERYSVYLLLARMLVEHAATVASRSGAPLSAKLVGTCTVNLPGVFEKNFPGYLAAGLAPMVAKQMQGYAG